LLTRTGDNMNEPWPPGNESNFYKDWSIQVLELYGDEYIDKTGEFMDSYFGSEAWTIFTKIKDRDNDGKLELFNTVNPYENPQNYLEWEIVGGQLIRID